MSRTPSWLAIALVLYGGSVCLADCIQVTLATEMAALNALAGDLPKLDASHGYVASASEGNPPSCAPTFSDGAGRIQVDRTTPFFVRLIAAGDAGFDGLRSQPLPDRSWHTARPQLADRFASSSTMILATSWLGGSR